MLQAQQMLPSEKKMKKQIRSRGDGEVVQDGAVGKVDKSKWITT